MRIAKVFAAITITLLTFWLTKEAYASEGTVEIGSITGANYRCFAASLLMQDLNFTMLVSCRDLIYPAEPDIFNYVLWAQPIEDKNPVKLGTLDFGKKEFRINKPFSSLFITTEQNPGVRSPEGNVVMQGQVRAINFLETAQPTIDRTPTETPETVKEEESTKTETKQLTTREKLFLALRRAGIAALFAFIALLGLIFVVTRSRA
jgi:hypothetical protein